MRVTFEVPDAKTAQTIQLLLTDQGFVFKLPKFYTSIGVPNDAVGTIIGYVIGELAKPAIDLMITAYKFELFFDNQRVAKLISSLVDQAIQDLRLAIEEVGQEPVARAMGRGIEIPSNLRWFHIGVEPEPDINLS